MPHAVVTFCLVLFVTVWFGPLHSKHQESSAAIRQKVILIGCRLELTFPLCPSKRPPFWLLDLKQTKDLDPTPFPVATTKSNATKPVNAQRQENQVSGKQQLRAENEEKINNKYH